MTALPTRVDPATDIPAQRERGWPDFHPEDYCHKCGNRNIPSWTVDSDRFNAAFGPHSEHPHQGIVCPTCFVLAHQEATGLRTTWHLEPHPSTPFRPIEPRVPSQRLPQVAPEPLGGDRPTAGKVTPKHAPGEETL